MKLEDLVEGKHYRHPQWPMGIYSTYRGFHGNYHMFSNLGNSDYSMIFTESYIQELEEYSHFEDLGSMLSVPPHQHKRKTYVGLTDTYDYCEDCGEKI